MIVQYAPPALSTVLNKADHPIAEKTAKSETTPKRPASDKLQECKRSTSFKSKSSEPRSKRKEDHLGFLTIPLDFLSKNTGVHIITKATCHLQTSHGITVTVMQPHNVSSTPEQAYPIFEFRLSLPIALTASIETEYRLFLQLGNSSYR